MLRRDSSGKFAPKLELLGKVDQSTLRLAKRAGARLTGGCIQDGRVLIYSNYPGSYENGLALRSRVVWWLNTGEVVDSADDIHHINEIRSDDTFTNLEKKTHVDHSHHHNPKTFNFVDQTCIKCGSPFQIKPWRLRDPTRGKYCSQQCYQNSPRAKRRVEADVTKCCEECGLAFSTSPTLAGRRRRFCSLRCAAKGNWRIRNRRISV